MVETHITIARQPDGRVFIKSWPNTVFIDSWFIDHHQPLPEPLIIKVDDLITITADNGQAVYEIVYTKPRPRGEIASYICSLVSRTPTYRRAIRPQSRHVGGYCAICGHADARHNQRPGLTYHPCFICRCAHLVEVTNR